MHAYLPHLMRQFRRIALALVALALLGQLVACGGGDPEDEPCDPYLPERTTAGSPDAHIPVFPCRSRAQ